MTQYREKTAGMVLAFFLWGDVVPRYWSSIDWFGSCLQACAGHEPVANNLWSLGRQIESMYHHVFKSYMYNAFAREELRPLSWFDAEMFRGLSPALIGTSDVLIVFSEWPSFVWAVECLRSNLTLDLNTTLLVFKITIWVVGRLFSAHGLLTDVYEDTDSDPQLCYPTDDDALLRLAVY